MFGVSVQERLHRCSVVWTGKEGVSLYDTIEQQNTVGSKEGVTMGLHHLKKKHSLFVRRNPMAGPIDRFNRSNLFWTRLKRSNVQDGIFNCWTISASIC